MEGNSSVGQIIAYPTGIVRSLLHSPVLIYRLGLGRLFVALPIMILTTRGRRTGLPRHTAVEYRQHGSKLYVISGWGTRPEWFKNLRAEPRVSVQVGGRQFAARGSLVESEGELLRALQLFRRRVPFLYDATLARISGAPTVPPREIPNIAGKFTIVRLDRDRDKPLPLPTVEPDLAWVLPTGLLVSAITVALVVFARTRR